ncbi:glutaryl-7-ACA acylase [Emticicia aquatilis]|uniref:Glutaryl-7-ACA acylase n=1 Tax=Emticicia aquatilis TaxID=1537369 RepID=A0A916YI99_9BACT|nr:CocE/NonD family hydrolase [Emticicia aquatilis]GGD46503.1 glutaryl-7-ACA acylase [Emticicia aquatilis]
MKNILSVIITAVFPLFSFAQKLTSAQQDSAFVRENFVKQEVLIPMRDGVKLFTSIYIPKDISASNQYAFLMQRTCFGSMPYGKDAYTSRLYYSRPMAREKFIFVKQDVRGRWMSEGVFTNMTPIIDNKTKPTDIDEASDTYDTVEWLLRNISNHNGRVGLYGISYPGFYAISGALSGHPAIKAVSPQAPVSDFYFEDFHHNGAFVLGVAFALPIFGVQHKKPTSKAWFDMPNINSENGYDWYKSMTPLKNLDKLYAENFFWNEIVQHPNYDEFWQKRSVIPHLKNSKSLPAMLEVGGWFDAEDMTGVLDIYKTIEKNKPNTTNTLVMGPFGHGDWSREKGHHLQGNIYFGDSLATFFQKNIELSFFKHYLKDTENKVAKLPEAYLFDTGKKEWQIFDKYPVSNTKKVDFYLAANGKLTNILPQKGFREYVSDPQNPVPYAETVKETVDFLPDYMSDDQRFVAGRADVLTFETNELLEDITFTGEIMAHLKFSTTGTDADFFIKLIDVYPTNEPNSAFTPPNIKLGGYQQMVRSEIMRAKYRNSFASPEPLVAEKQTDLDFKLQDVLHTFKKGHKIMIQVQSSAFPLFDMNPQKYVPNIYKANENDYQKATHKIFSESKISVNVLNSK